MVARGDLGVEMDLAQVPLLQKQIIERANAADRYVITATQMLQSMIDNSFPTRAEVTDVANAVIDGTDAVMLSGETAVGKYPFKTVQTMVHIAKTTETFLSNGNNNRWSWARINPASVMHNAMGHAALQLCKDIAAKAVAAYSDSGGTGLYLSKSRPFAPIIIFTSNMEAYRRMKLFWGVIPVFDNSIRNNCDLINRANKAVLEQGFAMPDDNIVIILSSDFGKIGNNNIIEIKKVTAKKSDCPEYMRHA
ncbi:pyruvate kinase [Candidatus Magnetoovum chiemensis]|nr:pyruvate kinase [Candidatus Magnetoovum chiemensis]